MLENKNRVTAILEWNGKKFSKGFYIEESDFKDNYRLLREKFKVLGSATVYRIMNERKRRVKMKNKQLKKKIEEMEFYNPGRTRWLKLSSKEVDELLSLCKEYALSCLPNGKNEKEATKEFVHEYECSWCSYDATDKPTRKQRVLGVLNHVRRKHPEKYEEFKINLEMAQKQVPKRQIND